MTRRGNPPNSPWRSTPDAARGRPRASFSLSPEAHDALEQLAIEAGEPRARVIERLILAALAKSTGAKKREP